MPTDIIDSLTRFITSPPGHLAAGGVLATIVWKFFERVEAVLTPDTRLEIAVWLLDVKAGPRLARWPDTFAKMFDRVFGTNHFSLTCLLKSVLASYCVLVVLYAVTALDQRAYHRVPIADAIPHLFLWGIIGSALPDYVSLLETRYVLKGIAKARSIHTRLGFLLIDLSVTTALGILASQLTASLYIITHAQEMHWTGTHSVLALTKDMILLLALNPRQFFYQVGSGFDYLFFAGAFFTSVWLWLYAGSGVLLKAARRLDVGFAWFNRKFDIEQHPLQSIGLIAGALVALVYWLAVSVHKLVS